MTSTLGTLAARGAFLNGFAQLIRIVLGLVGTAIVARILVPADYGVVAMVAPIAAFVALFPSLGIGPAIIQARELSKDELDSAFRATCYVAVGASLALVLLSPAVGWFFTDLRVIWLTAASGLTLLVTSLTIVHSAMLSRELEFAKLSIADIVSSSTLFISTVGAAMITPTYWALWIGTLFSALATSIYVWWASAWSPSKGKNVRDGSRLFKFGRAVTGFNLLNFLSRNADNVLIGKFAGAAQLGLYDRSYRIMMAPISNMTAPIGKVMLPVLSRLQDNPVDYRDAFLKASWAIMMFTAPLALVAVFAGERVVGFVLGDQWTGAVPIFFWLSIGAVYQPLSSITGWLYLSLGRGPEMLRWGAISSVTTLAAFGVGIFWGAVGVAAAFVLVSVARLPLLYFWSTRTTPVRQRDLYAILIVLMLTACAVHLLVSQLPEKWNDWQYLCVALICAYGSILIISLFFEPARRSLRAIYDQTALMSGVGKQSRSEADQ